MCLKNQVLVNSPYEPYVGETCAGVITEMLIPAAASLNASYAPWQPPGFLQSVVEARARVLAVDSTRMYFPPQCNLALRKVVCATLILKPHASGDASGALRARFGGDVYVPSFPHRQVSAAYGSSLFFDCKRKKECFRSAI